MHTPQRLREPVAAGGDPTQTARTGSAPRIHVLDALRLVAALAVMSYHYMARGGGWPTDVKAMFPSAFPVAAYGWLGVQLFFLISGFVICMTCWDKSLRGFFVSRVVRLYPAYWFAIVATTVTVAVVPGGARPLPWSDVLTNLTMLQEALGVEHVDGVYWTLFVELRFYLLFAVVTWWGLTYRRVLLFCCVWAAASALWAGAPVNDPLRLLIMPDNSWYFIAGIALYLMHRFRPNLMLAGVVLLCFCSSLPFALSTWRNTGTYMGHTVPSWPVIVIVAASFGIVALVATTKLSRISWRWPAGAGALTYPLYLLHQVIGRELFGLLSPHAPPGALLALVVAAMLVLAWLVHRYVERPLGRRLKQGLAQL
ncbi:acyltransferase family protein [Streptomyces sp. NPDC058964]|uniref:acyltransferase family protein n=1 Tax=Streptomyces sp. NPDC058964 TaxID=3346681 RepID=UPI0036B2B424